MYILMLLWRMFWWRCVTATKIILIVTIEKSVRYIMKIHVAL